MPPYRVEPKFKRENLETLILIARRAAYMFLPKTLVIVVNALLHDPDKTRSRVEDLKEKTSLDTNLLEKALRQLEDLHFVSHETHREKKGKTDWPYYYVNFPRLIDSLHAKIHIMEQQIKQSSSTSLQEYKCRGCNYVIDERQLRVVKTKEVVILHDGTVLEEYTQMEAALRHRQNKKRVVPLCPKDGVRCGLMLPLNAIVPTKEEFTKSLGPLRELLQKVDNMRFNVHPGSFRIWMGDMDNFVSDAPRSMGLHSKGSKFQGVSKVKTQIRVELRDDIEDSLATATKSQRFDIAQETSLESRKALLAQTLGRMRSAGLPDGVLVRGTRSQVSQFSIQQDHLDSMAQLVCNMKMPDEDREEDNLTQAGDTCVNNSIKAAGFEDSGTQTDQFLTESQFFLDCVMFSCNGLENGEYRLIEHCMLRAEKLRSAVWQHLKPVMGIRPSSKLLRLNISRSNEQLMQQGLTNYISSLRARHGSDTMLYGGYLENRNIYESHSAFASRTVHLGVDLWLPAGSPVMMPLDGVVVRQGNNEGEGNYGPTIITRHSLPGTNGGQLFILFGHLSKHRWDENESANRQQKCDSPFLRSTQEWLPFVADWQRDGITLKAGQIIGYLGQEQENGGYPPHLHMQCMLSLDHPVSGRPATWPDTDYPGVCNEAEVEDWAAHCPNPFSFIKMRMSTG